METTIYRRGSFLCIAILLILLKTYNRPTKMLLIAEFCANFERIYLSFFNIMKTEINNKLVVACPLQSRL